MGSFHRDRNQSKNKKRLSKNKSIKLYKEKKSKIEQFQQEVQALKQKYNEIDSQNIEKFEDFPLSERTRKGLKKAGYINPTDIQKDCIGLALKGHDILGAAKTGSGKTLAFIIPMLESLYCAGWTIIDGLGALVITPTRELAYQIFEVLNNIGSFHTFSAALVIGGKDLAIERKALNKCNILICTPGRLLQHMDENSLFDASNLRMLVLDEADQILSMGFEKTVNAILENLPTDRQTLLFSATQTRSVKDLARLSLQNPMYISVHEHAKYSTPEGLTQNYMICEAHSKMNLLWSFIKSHKQQKTLVFVSTCKQVKFLQESIIRLKPGSLEILGLHGHLHQLRRMEIYKQFCKNNHAVLLATDVAARGLDFPNVNWVVQLDCPEDTNTYIHRVGRTARYQQNGESLLVLLPSEKPMVEYLKQRKIPIEELYVDPAKMFNVQRKLEAMLARDNNLKSSAQRAYRCYIKNIAVMKDKTIFDVNMIDLEKYARSLGLVSAPRLRFLKKFNIKQETAKNSFISHGSGSESDDDDDLLKPKGAPELPSLVEDEIDEHKESKKLLTKAAVAKRILKKKIKANSIMKFDDEGNPIREICGKAVPVVASEIQNQILEEGYSIEKAKLLKEKEEEVDKIIFRERVKQKHREERLKSRSKREKEVVDAPQLSEGDNDKEDASESEVDPNDMLSQNSEEDEDSESDDDAQEQSSSEEELSDQESEAEHENSKKRKNIHNPGDVKRHKRDLNVTSLDEEEDLALHFLTNS